MKIKFTTYEKCFLFFGSVVSIALSIYSKSSLLNTIYTFCCIFSAVLMTKGRIEGYFFELAVSACYLIIAFNQQYYSEAVTSIIIIPVTIYGAISWFKNHDTNNTIYINKISPKELIIVFAVTTALFPLFYYLISLFNKTLIIYATLSFMFTMLAHYFISRMSPLSYFLYIAKDIMVIILWLEPLLSGDLTVATVILSTVLYFINDIYGIINWNRLYKQQNTEITTQ